MCNIARLHYQLLDLHNHGLWPPIRSHSMNLTGFSRNKSIGFLFLALFLISSPEWAHAQTPPWEDIGFSPETVRPDPDLVIVRERAYGAEGVDLTAYGIGTGPVDFVQSIYFRFFVDLEAGSYDSFIARVEFPQDVTILGIIIDNDELGGSIDDGVATDMDNIFGVAADPDDYSEANRGFEQLGGEGTSEFVAMANGDNSLVFGLNVEEGMDDFRVIIDYGSEYRPNLSFDVYSYRIGQLGGAVPDLGFLVGDDVNPIVFGSGDYGEAGSLTGIPLTANTLPATGGSIPFSPTSNIFILRDQGGSRTTLVDGFDVNLALPAPDLHTYVTTPLRLPVAITDGNDGRLYSLGSSFGLAVTTPGLDDTVEMTLEQLAGTCVDITNLSDPEELYVLRDQTSGDTFIDVLDTGDFTFTDHIALTGSDVTEPVAITDDHLGMIFVADADGGYAIVNTLTHDVVTGDVALPAGAWKDATRQGDMIYLLREKSVGQHTIDVFDPQSPGIAVFGLIDLFYADNPAAITDGPNRMLYVVSRAANEPAFITIIDPTVPEIVHEHNFLHFPGWNVSVTNLKPNATAVPRSGGLPSAGYLQTAAAPNPFNPRVTISYSLERDAQVRVAIYDIHGRLVRTLHNGPQSVGEQSTVWDGRDRHGRNMPSGTYLYRVDTGAVAGFGKVVLAK